MLLAQIKSNYSSGDDSSSDGDDEDKKSKKVKKEKKDDDGEEEDGDEDQEGNTRFSTHGASRLQWSTFVSLVGHPVPEPGTLSVS